jgi:hypothetical protein
MRECRHVFKPVTMSCPEHASLISRYGQTDHHSRSRLRRSWDVKEPETLTPETVAGNKGALSTLQEFK